MYFYINGYRIITMARLYHVMPRVNVLFLLASRTLCKYVRRLIFSDLVTAETCFLGGIYSIKDLTILTCRLKF